mmetsp:Transcript_16893/g.39295  ORF Transcript_16893/g.39295 Transcript_16893/m.39295 type:complete len:234 (-) Transcript_16893:2330-3031(-)
MSRAWKVSALSRKPFACGILSDVSSSLLSWMHPCSAETSVDTSISISFSNTSSRSNSEACSLRRATFSPRKRSLSAVVSVKCVAVTSFVVALSASAAGGPPAKFLTVVGDVCVAQAVFLALGATVGSATVGASSTSVEIAAVVLSAAPDFCSSHSLACNSVARLSAICSCTSNPDFVWRNSSTASHKPDHSLLSPLPRCAPRASSLFPSGLLAPAVPWGGWYCRKASRRAHVS